MGLKEIAGMVIPALAKLVRAKNAEGKVAESALNTEGGESGFANSNVNRWEWRNITDAMDSGDELDIQNHHNILRRAYSAWCRNPLAGQIVNLTTWFVMGKGVAFTARENEVQNILFRFWTDPDNDLTSMQHWMSNELQIYGEIFIRFFVNPIDGSVRLGLIDPLEIIDIVTDPDDIRKPVHYLREYKRSPLPDDWLDSFRTCGGMERFSIDDDTVKEIIDAGDVLHVKVNNVSNRKRGISELYRVLPWLDAYNRWLEHRIAINRARGTFAFLRKVPAMPSRASGPFDTDSSGKFIVPKPGSILVVHDSEDWQVLAPKVGADDAKEDGRAIKLMIAAGSGIFEHYFGDPSTGNLATTRSMELPMVKKFEDRQRLFEHVFARIFDKVIDSAINAGMLPPDIDRSVEVNFPPIVPEDIALLTDTLIDQVEAGLLSKDSARRMIPWIGDSSHEAIAVEYEQRKKPGGKTK